MATKITSEMLEPRRPCEQVFRRFKRQYPAGIYITIRNVLELQKHFSQLSLFWAIDEFCVDRARDRFLAATVEIYRRRTVNGLTLKKDREEYARAFVKAWNSRSK